MPFPYCKTKTQAVFSHNELVTWGWQAEVRNYAGCHLVSGFKAALDPDRSVDYVLPSELTKLEVVSEYFRALKNMVLSNMAKNGVEPKPRCIRWSIAIPSSWHEESRALVLSALQTAGIVAGAHGVPSTTSSDEGSPHEPYVLLESEAAALYALNYLGDLQQLCLR
jgi:hypothetical protein